MLIQYHGDACVRLTGKTAAGEFTVLTDPYDAKVTGLKAIRPSAVDLVLSTSGTLPEFEAGPFRVVSPGEYEVRGVMVKGISVGTTTIYRIAAEGLAIAHLGNLAQPLTAEVQEKLGDVDVLLIPVGGHGVLTAKQAGELIEQIEPRIVIPLQYKLADAKLPYDGPEAFCKEMGCTTKPEDDKLRIAKKDVPAEEMWVRVLGVS